MSSSRPKMNGIIFALVFGIMAFLDVSCCDSPEDDGCWDSYDEYIIEYPDTQEVLISACDTANVYFTSPIHTFEEADSVISGSDAVLISFKANQSKGVAINFGIEEYNCLIENEKVLAIHPFLSNYPNVAMGCGVCVKFIPGTSQTDIDLFASENNLTVAIVFSDVLFSFSMNDPKQTHPLRIVVKNQSNPIIEWIEPRYLADWQ